MITKRDLRLGKNIKKFRKRAKLTQEQLAEKTRLSTPYVGYLEIGYNRPSLKTLYKIATVLKAKVRELIPY